MGAGVGVGGVQPALANGAIVVSAERRSGPDCTPGHRKQNAQVLKCVAVQERFEELV